MVVNQLEKSLITPVQLETKWHQEDFQLLPHQIEAAKRVIWEMNGRALLADEVGLGKTIEAGLILKEYLLRDMIDTCLILTPASLGFQWWQELNDKFNIEVFNNRKGKSWNYFNVIVSSLNLAKQEHHRSKIYERGFDLVIVDEAQRLKNKTTQNWDFVHRLPKKYLLLLTATPVQNKIRELYNLLQLLKPKKFNDYKQFKQKYKGNNLAEIKKQLSEVMIRNERSDIEWNGANREVELIPLELTKREQTLYQEITDLASKESANENSLQRLTLQREVCSSPFSVVKSLQGLKQKEGINGQSKIDSLIKLAAEIEKNRKLQKLEQILATSSRRVIVFTEYKATQGYLGYYLQQEGYNPVIFNGNLSDNQKEWSKRRFQSEGDVLLSTGAGRQGINLQFCSLVVNYDLPWNPMRLEQRIGRVDRLGQAKEVTVYNLATYNTVEEKIINILANKIDLFEQVIGELNDLVRAGENSLH